MIFRKGPRGTFITDQNLSMFQGCGTLATYPNIRELFTEIKVESHKGQEVYHVKLRKEFEPTVYETLLGYRRLSGKLAKFLLEHDIIENYQFKTYTYFRDNRYAYLTKGSAKDFARWIKGTLIVCRQRLREKEII